MGNELSKVNACEGRGGPIGAQDQTGFQRRELMVLGGYLVPFETGAGRISYRGLFVAETLRLGGGGILRESPLADPLKREHREKFKGTQR